MERTYKVILTPEAEGYTVFVPDFNCGTQGTDFDDALYMAKDLIAVMGSTLHDMGKEIPESNTAAYAAHDNDIVIDVNIDF